MTTAFIEKLNAPEWQMDDAYGDIGSERYEESFRKAESLISELEAAPRGRDAILSNLGRYDEATTILSSLSSWEPFASSSCGCGCGSGPRYHNPWSSTKKSSSHFTTLSAQTPFASSW